MGSPQINIAYDHNQDHIMGERDNHIDQGTSLSPEGNYSHIDMVRKRELLMERCSPEKMKETAAAAATALGGSGPWPLLLPWRWCWSLDGSPPQDGCQGGGNFVVPFDLGFLSLGFPSSRLRLQQIGSPGRIRTRIGTNFISRTIGKNSLQLCSFKFFRLRLYSGVSEAISKTCLVGTDFGRVRVQLQQGSFL